MKVNQLLSGWIWWGQSTCVLVLIPLVLLFYHKKNADNSFQNYLGDIHKHSVLLFFDPLATLPSFFQTILEWAWFSQSGWRKCKKKWNLTQKLQWKFYSTTPPLQHSSNLMILNVLHPKLFSPNWTLVNALLKKIGKKTNICRARKEKKSGSENVKSNSQGGTATFWTQNLSHNFTFWTCQKFGSIRNRRPWSAWHINRPQSYRRSLRGLLCPNLWECKGYRGNLFPGVCLHKRF